MASDIPDVELVTVVATSMSAVDFGNLGASPYIPLEVDSLNDKAQSRANRVDIFIHDLFDNSCFPGIVKSSVSLVSTTAYVERRFLQHQDSQLLVF